MSMKVFGLCLTASLALHILALPRMSSLLFERRAGSEQPEAVSKVSLRYREQPQVRPSPRLPRREAPRPRAHRPKLEPKTVVHQQPKPEPPKLPRPLDVPLARRSQSRPTPLSEKADKEPMRPIAPLAGPVEPPSPPPLSDPSPLPVEPTPIADPSPPALFDPTPGSGGQGKKPGDHEAMALGFAPDMKEYGGLRGSVPSVTVEVTVGPDGKADYKLRSSSGNGALDNYILQRLSQSGWKWEPAVKDGQPVESPVEVKLQGWET